MTKEKVITIREAEKMMDKVIRKYGFESDITIIFCETVEDYFKGLEDVASVKADFDFLMNKKIKNFL